MKVLNISDFGEVQLEWNSRHGAHSKNVTTEIPADVRVHVDALVDWAIGKGDALRDANEKYESERDIDREIAKLELRRREIRGR